MNSGAFYTGTYRNLFKEYGYSETVIDARIQETWNTMFFGDEDERIYFEVDDSLGYMLDTGNIDVRTEGMSYGMMMAVQMNNQDVFNRLWNWTMKYMFLTEGENAGYFAWSCSPDGTKNSYGPAPDGEEYFALALFFASHRWEMEKEFSTTVNKQETYYIHVYIKEKMELATRCGIRKIS
ncbi:endo-1,4-beta-xylanase A precursor [Halalkalibacter akibai JCM 9157]|uniref:Endo-1,4-beta-xylanase A n=1 Tax=Halalkalibacter akibai (strain ATCC 43226 / DSM 21942 / CIP 109018 / JCM 9157 / 1139) TaxID=1236973 RepID=W4QNU0_HALA3|nr:glycosyl hydrolase family 8 [Halalkalibacter akibai]GAE33567.1 endo-1,4-beta-xylanase A precursor [Halalkalibacter akibai JCM 9157]